MGRFIKVPGVNPPTDRPKVDLPDPVMPTAGTLALFEFAHPLGAFPSGVPSNGQALRNIAREQAAAAIGGTEASTDTALVVASYTAGAALLQRTGKGGVHSAHSQSAAASGGIYVPYPVAVLNFLAANPDHDIYMSMWGRITRPGNSTQAWAGISFAASPSPSQMLASISQDGNNYPTSATRLGTRRVPSGAWRPSQTPSVAAGPLFGSVGVSAYSGTPESVQRKGKAMSIRTGEPFTGSTVPADQLSGVLYRAYLEDLTISGRTYAQVDALDYELFTKEVVTAGGRYYGDTFTDPATLA